MARGRHFRKDKPADIYRGMEKWLHWGPVVMVAVLVAGAVIAWRQGADTRMYVVAYPVPVLCNVGAWWLARKSRPLLLRNAEMMDRQRG